MDKIWYLSIDGEEEGPYSIQDLRRHPSVTPNTLAWREGLDSWKPIRQISELKELFYEKPPQDKQTKQSLATSIPTENEVVLDFYKDPYFLILWLLVILLILIYALYAIR